LGFSASLCEISEETACSSSPCRNNGKCLLKSLKDYECQCQEGFSGKLKTTETNIFISDQHLYDLQEKTVTNQTCALLRLAKMEELVPFFLMATNSNAFVL
jgi:EGF-like domain